MFARSGKPVSFIDIADTMAWVNNTIFPNHGLGAGSPDYIISDSFKLVLPLHYVFREIYSPENSPIHDALVYVFPAI